MLADIMTPIFWLLLSPLFLHTLSHVTNVCPRTAAVTVNHGLRSRDSRDVRVTSQPDVTPPPLPVCRRTSVLFVSMSFILLLVISLAWLLFYYVQRFRYMHAKDRLAVGDRTSCVNCPLKERCLRRNFLSRLCRNIFGYNLQ